MSSAYEQEILAWRAARRARLVAEDGWLSILAKLALPKGTSRIGSDPTSDVVLPEKAPPHLGTARLEDGVLQIDPAPGVSLVSAGKEVWTLGTLRFEVLHKGGDTYLRVKDKESARRLGFGEVPSYPIDEKWRITARLEPYVPKKRVDLDYEEGLAETYESPGRAVFEVDGVEHSLDPVLDQGTPRLYVLVKDETSRDTTYGAGRFLYAPLPSAGRDTSNATVVLDFNQLFNPPCAFTPHVNCPIVPAQNRLKLRVEAGEKRPSEH